MLGTGCGEGRSWVWSRVIHLATRERSLGFECEIILNFQQILKICIHQNEKIQTAFLYNKMRPESCNARLCLTMCGGKHEGRRSKCQARRRTDERVSDETNGFLEGISAGHGSNNGKHE